MHAPHQSTSPFLQTLIERGFVHQITDLEHLEHLSVHEKVTMYIGFDCTAPSLHVGNLMGIMMLRHAQAHGHHPIIVLGGGTTRIGDPSGKEETRKLLDENIIKENIQSIQTVVSQYISFKDNEATLVNNAEWLDGINYIDFLRDVGKHFSVNRMLSFDNIRLRLEREQNLSFLEFNYMLLQSYDFVELYRRYGCRLQMGGSDQWGNIVSGIELGRKMQGVDLYGLTCPLITTSSGAKMGKTAAGAVWLKKELCSVYDYWQFWRNTEDKDVGRFLRIYTDLPLAEITRLEQLKGSELNEAKKILATHATALCHGEEEAQLAAKTAGSLFEKNTLNTERQLPRLEIKAEEWNNGIKIYVLIKDAGLAETGAEARRLIRSKAVKLNDRLIENEDEYIFAPSESVKEYLLSVGKKRYVTLRVK